MSRGTLPNTADVACAMDKFAGTARVLIPGLVAIVLIMSGCMSHMVRGDRALAKGNWARAIKEFETAIADDPTTADAARPGLSRAELGLGRDALERGATDEAADHFVLALDRDGTNAWAWFHMALLAMADQDFTAAEYDFSRAVLHANTSDASAMHDRILENAETAYQADDAESTAIYLDAVRLHFPHLPGRLLPRLAQTAYRAGYLDTAIEAWRIVLEGRPGDAGASAGLIDALLDRANGAMGYFDLASAENDLRDVLAIDPDRSEAHYLLGIALEGQAEFEEAIGEFKLVGDGDYASPANRGRARCVCSIGETLLAAGDVEAAKRAFDEALVIDPASVEAHLGLAEYYVMTPITLTKKEKNFLVANNRGEHAKRLKETSQVQRYGRALAELKKALDLAPDDVLVEEKSLELILQSGYEFVGFTDVEDAVVVVRNDTRYAINLEVRQMNGKTCKFIESSPERVSGLFGNVDMKGYRPFAIGPGDSWTFHCKPGAVALDGQYLEINAVSFVESTWIGADYMEAHLEYHWNLVSKD